MKSWSAKKKPATKSKHFRKSSSNHQHNNIMQALSLIGQGYSISVTPEAEKQKAELLASTAGISEVTGPLQQSIALAAIKDLTEYISAVEKTRTVIKAPILDIGKDIDAKAANFVGELLAGKNRLVGLCQDFAAEQARKAREAQEAADREARAVEARRLEVERAEREAEAARQRAALAAQEATNKKTRAAAAAQQAEADRLANEARKQREEDEQKRIATLPAPVVLPVQGVKPSLDFEIVDAWELFRAMPELCEVTVKRASVLVELKVLQSQSRTASEINAQGVFPGLKIIEKFNVQTR